jgi:trimethylamine corrinoid protein
MEQKEWFQMAAQSILDLDEKGAKETANKALEAGVDPMDMIHHGFTDGIRTMGDLFEREEIFLPSLLIASEIMLAAVEILESALPRDRKQEKLGVIVIGTVEGDIHDIGKGIVTTMLRVHGYEVHDLGRDVPVEKFIEKIKEVKADVVGSSAMMTTTQIGQRRLEESLEEAGIRDRIKTMVGGAVGSDDWAAKIGADFYGETPQETIEKLGKLGFGRSSSRQIVE